MASRFIVFVSVAALMACRGPDPRSGPPLPAPSSTDTSALASSPSIEAVRESPAPPSAADARAPATSPSTAAEALGPFGCSSPKTEVRLPADSGAIFDNAMTTGEAGNADRARSILSALRAALPTLRCCFEPWAATLPTTEARVVLRIALDADGKATSTEIVPSRSTLAEPTTLACLNAAAMRLTYGVSPTQRSTLVEYPLSAVVPR